MARPLIGVCAAVERASFGVWKEEPAILLPLSYARAIHGAGGHDGDAAAGSARHRGPGRAARPDRRAGAGRRRRHRSREPRASRPTPRRSAPTPTATASRSPSRWVRWSGACRCSASAAGCRSSTSPAVARSTSTSPSGSGTSIHRPVPGSWAEHEVRIEPGSLAAERGGTERAHREEPSPPGRRPDRRELTASAWATDDESVEAIESGDGGLRAGRALAPGGGRGGRDHSGARRTGVRLAGRRRARAAGSRSHSMSRRRRTASWCS